MFPIYKMYKFSHLHKKFRVSTDFIFFTFLRLVILILSICSAESWKYVLLSEMFVTDLKWAATDIDSVNIRKGRGMF